MMRATGLGLAVASGLLMAGSAHAGIVWTNTTIENGAGLGSVTTALTIHDNDGVQEGCVGWTGSMSATGAAYCNTAVTGIAGGNEGAGSVQNEAWSFAQLGNPTSADQLRFIFNGAEPGSGPSADITITDMYATIWSSAGLLLYTSGNLTSPATFVPQGGVGVSGEVFAFDLTDILAIDGSALDLLNPANHLGFIARTINSEGGLDTFYMAAVVVQTPEPAALAFLGIGLLGASALRRRRSAARA